MKIAIVGTQGVPSRYGGFETLVEYLAEVLGNKMDITIFCSAHVYKDRQPTYKNCKLSYVNFKANGLQSILFDIASIFKAIRKFDKILILGASGGIIMPFLKPWKKKFILNIGGLDWKRSKWNYFTQKYIKISERFAIRNSKYLISDNVGIQEYILKEYKRESTLISYGGDQVLNVTLTDDDIKRYPFLKNDYTFSLARIQSDNNIEMILDAFVYNPKMPIVFVGNWNNSKYGIFVKDKYSYKENIILLDAIYDQRELDLLRSNAKLYVHGHSAGGTNPALVEAMNLGLPIIAFTSGFNEFTTYHKAEYFSTTEELKVKITNTSHTKLLQLGTDMKSIAQEHYIWNNIAEKYAEMFM